MEVTCVGILIGAVI